MDLTLVLAFVTGLGVAAAAGLRAFLPLLAVGIAGRLGWIELKPEVAWLAQDPVLICLGVATVAEILGDKFPVVDHALDAIGTVIRPVAAWVGAYAVLGQWPTPWAQVAALVLGGGAFAMNAFKAKLRIGSTATTLGHANPILSVIEDMVSVVLLVAAFLLPLLVLAIVAAAIVGLAGRRRANRKPPVLEARGSGAAAR